MANLNDILEGVISDVDGALGCAVVDLDSGLLLSAAHHIPYFTTSYLEAVAAAAVDIVFQFYNNPNLRQPYEKTL
jgi:hypothetical protein